MQLFQGEALSLGRRLLFCLLLAFGLAATLSWVTPDTNAIQPSSNSLGGHVTDQNGVSFPNITITLSGSESRTQQTDSNGNFLFDNLATGGNYQVTPAKTGYLFTPSSFSVTNLNGSFTSTFSGTPTAPPTPTPTPTATPTPSPNSFQFTTSTTAATETPNVTTKVELNVTRVGDTSGPASVNYATSDGTAIERSDYLTAIGTLRFASSETLKTITIFIVNDSYGESDENFNVALSSPVGGTLGAPSVVTVTIHSDESVDGPNPVRDASFDTDFFVREHYVDFFNREADSSGLAFWKDQINSCTTQACREIRRINVSAAFFLSIEFQQTGYLVERLYKASYGDAIGTSNFGPTHQLSVPVIRFREFLSDTQQIGRGVIIGEPGADQTLENNKQTLISEFAQRPRFLTAYPISMTPAQFVDTLNTNAGSPLSPAERSQLVSDLTSGGKTRAQVLRAVAEDPDLFAAENNRAFVLAQYFGYLRRNPNDTPDSDYTGYDFWLGKLNQFNGNFVDAEMVKSFLVSGEYIQRFGP